MANSIGRHRPLAEELTEAGLDLRGDDRDLLIEEVDHALRPPSTSDAFPAAAPSSTRPPTRPVGTSTALSMTREPTRAQPLDAARRFADGLSTRLLRQPDAPTGWLLFDRPAGSERDLGVIARTMGATVVQRHPAGLVRVVDDFGVLRRDRYSWHHEPPVERWIDIVRACTDPRDVALLRALLGFAVHDLGANGIGALFVHRGTAATVQGAEQRPPTPPKLRIDEPMTFPTTPRPRQIAGAAIFDPADVLRHLDTRLILSPDAERSVDGFKGTRHTSGLRYSYDDPTATVIAISEDGPVSVFHRGAILGRSDCIS